MYQSDNSLGASQSSLYHVLDDLEEDNNGDWDDFHQNNHNHNKVLAAAGIILSRAIIVWILKPLKLEGCQHCQHHDLGGWCHVNHPQNYLDALSNLLYNKMRTFHRACLVIVARVISWWAVWLIVANVTMAEISGEEIVVWSMSLGIYCWNIQLMNLPHQDDMAKKWNGPNANNHGREKGAGGVSSMRP